VRRESLAVISCYRNHLIARCRQRGYTLDEVRPCIVSEDGDTITVDETHPAYPAKPKPGFAKPQAMAMAKPTVPTSGPGTELKKLLSKVGITTKPGCACNKRARVMDEKGCDWCAENLSTITAWLKEEHTRQKIMLPFSETAVSLLVRYAIRRARAIAK
jgi:hypothetical protein